PTFTVTVTRKCVSSTRSTFSTPGTQAATKSASERQSQAFWIGTGRTQLFSICIQPQPSHILRSLVLPVDPAKFLNPLPGLDLGGVNVSLAVDRDVVERGELARLSPRPAEAAERLLKHPRDDAYLAVHAVDHLVK